VSAMLLIYSYMQAYVAIAEKIGNVMTRRVANKQRKQDP